MSLHNTNSYPQEEGCLRFDVIREPGSNKFWFYEMYTDEAALATHKSTVHFQSWADFKASGGVLSQTVVKGEGIFIGK